MKILIFFSGIVGISQAFRLWQPGHKQQQTGNSVSMECCKLNGGHQCGFGPLKECCKNGCVTKYFVWQTCKNGEIFAPVCKTCINACHQKQGVPCGVSINSGKVSCCPKQSCTPSGKKLTDLISEKVQGKISPGLNPAAAKTSVPKNKKIEQDQDQNQNQNQQQYHHYKSEENHQFYDMVAKMVFGEQDKCQPGTQIPLGNCVADGFMTLVGERVN